MPAPLNTGLAASLKRMLGATGDSTTNPVITAWGEALDTEPPVRDRAVDIYQGSGNVSGGPRVSAEDQLLEKICSTVGAINPRGRWR